MAPDIAYFNGSTPSRRRFRRSRRGLTLVESLIASVLLVTVVTAVLGALSAGHQHALEAKRLITASLAAEQLMARVATTSYTDLARWDGWEEAPGTATDAQDAVLPDLFELVGRRVTITSATQELERVQVVLQGSLVTIESFDDQGRVLTRLVRFIPEPQT